MQKWKEEKSQSQIYFFQFSVKNEKNLNGQKDEKDTQNKIKQKI